MQVKELRQVKTFWFWREYVPPYGWLCFTEVSSVFFMKQETMCFSDFAFLKKHELHNAWALGIFEIKKNGCIWRAYEKYLKTKKRDNSIRILLSAYVAKILVSKEHFLLRLIYHSSYELLKKFNKAWQHQHHIYLGILCTTYLKIASVQVMTSILLVLTPRTQINRTWVPGSRFCRYFCRYL